MGIIFEIEPSGYAEILDEARDARVVAQELALGKALDVARRHMQGDKPEDVFVVGSDTIVAINGRQMEKPKNRADAEEMLVALTKGASSVSTGLAVVNLARGIQLVGEDTTVVNFKPDGPEMTSPRKDYLDSGDWKDKAGGYGIQSGAAPLIESISGHYDTVVGLPTSLLEEYLGRVGIEAHAVYEKPPVRELKAA